MTKAQTARYWRDWSQIRKMLVEMGDFSKEDAAELPATQPQFLIRLFEAAAATDYPDADVVEFRQTLETHLGRHFGLSEFKAAAIAK